MKNSPKRAILNTAHKHKEDIMSLTNQDIDKLVDTPDEELLKVFLRLVS